jgi:hypothetical protein
MMEDRDDLEQDIEIDAEELDSGPEPESRAPAAAEDDDAELESYSKNVQSRIKKLTEKYRKEERDRQEAVRIAQQLMDENQKLKGRVTQLDSGYLGEYGARVEAQVAAARRAYKEAYESGDADRVLDAQEGLSRAIADQDRYSIAKQRADRLQTERAQQPAAQQPAYQQPAAQQAPKVDAKAQSWAEKNDWFGQDEVMTYAAFGIHRKLVEDEGFDPQSDEYYSEIDRRLRSEFPNKFKVERKSGGGTQVASAGSSASRSTKQGRRSVKLTPSQIAIARKLNVPLEEYAKYVKD